ncbi:hypothetical protein [Bdellovibrio bacteriovorus]|uniref:hypothetical protein n=1 Tax=Bdellovibrio bacteriovorus TaxID=959 RepID=UPI0035A6981A
MASEAQGSAIKNAAWLLSGGVSTAILTLICSTLVARLMDVNMYGVLQIGTSIFLFLQLAERICHPDIVKNMLLMPNADSEKVIVSASQIMIAANFLVLLGLVTYVFWIDSAAPLLLAIPMVIGQFFRAANGISYYYDSQLLSRKTQLNQLGGYLVGNAYRVLAAIVQPTAILQTIYLPICYAATAFLNLKSYKIPMAKFFRVDLNNIKIICRLSFPLFLTSIISLVLTRADILLLGWLSTPDQVSFYSNAVRLSEPWNFVSNAIINSYFPILVSGRLEAKRSIIKELGIYSSYSLWRRSRSPSPRKWLGS